jgi:hypothetical protein
MRSFRTEMQTGFERLEQLVGQMDAKFEQRFEGVGSPPRSSLS